MPDTNPDWLSSGSGRLPAGEPGASLALAGRVPAVIRWHPTDDVEVILATIRQLESGGRYRIGPNKAGASGAYQFIASTWNHYGGYPEAYLAPREVQDARARADVVRFLQMHEGDVSMVPVLWYYPRAVTEPEWMDRVPNPAGGNVLTVRQYQQRWLQVLERKQAQMRPDDEAEPEPGAVSVLSEPTFSTTSSEISRGRVTTTGERSDSESFSELDRSAGGGPATHTTGTPEPETPADRHRTPGAPTTADEQAMTVDEITVSDETTTAAVRSMPPGDELPHHAAGSRRSIAFPVLGPVTYHDGWGDCRDGCARRHEGTDIIGVRMQPLLAAVDGTIHTQRYESRGTAGVILSIIDDDGWRYNYFHLNNDTPGTDDGQASNEWRFPPGLQEGNRVEAGQIIGYMGDSGNSEHSVPHLHFELRDPAGNARPSYWSLKAAEARQACTIGLGPWSLPHPSTEPIPRELAALVAQQQQAIERDVETTTVTPLHGDGQWLIDTEGRVTATGDAALITGSRDLECEPGPTTAHGADAAGWHTRPTTTLLHGTMLEDTPLEHTALADLPPPPTTEPDSHQHHPPHQPPRRTDDDPVAYQDPSTSETIIVLDASRQDTPPAVDQRRG